MFRKIIIISGSKKDKLTKKVLKIFDKYSITYILIDYDNLTMFYSLNKNLIKIKSDFSGDDLKQHFKQLEKKNYIKKEIAYFYLNLDLGLVKIFMNTNFLSMSVKKTLKDFFIIEDHLI